MKIINLTKYGFTRAPEHDFSDDGTRFTCYTAAGVLVSKASDTDYVYIDGHSEILGYNKSLPYEIYGNLPHYAALSALNGVRKDSITEQQLSDLYDACREYTMEFREAAEKFPYPTLQEIKDRDQAEIDQAKADYKEILDILSAQPDAILKLYQQNPYSSYGYSTRFLDKLSRLKTIAESKVHNDYPEEVRFSAYQAQRLKTPIEHSTYYIDCKEILDERL